MDKLTNNIVSSFNEVFKITNTIISQDEESYEYLNNLKQVSDNLYNLKSILSNFDKLLGNIKHEFDNRYDEIKNSIEIDKSENKIITKPNGNLYYPLSKINIIDLMRKKQNKPELKTERIKLNINGNKLTVPKISSFKKIPECLYWVDNPELGKKGLYIRLIGNVFYQIPLPNVLNENDKSKTIKCKYETKERCYNNRKTLAQKHGSYIRDCTFAHIGEQYNKISIPSKCNKIPNIGNPITLKNDLTYLLKEDINILLMYGLSDLLVSALWWEKLDIDESIINDNIDTCS